MTEKIKSELGNELRKKELRERAAVLKESFSNLTDATAVDMEEFGNITRMS